MDHLDANCNWLHGEWLCSTGVKYRLCWRLANCTWCILCLLTYMVNRTQYIFNGARLANRPTDHHGQLPQLESWNPISCSNITSFLNPSMVESICMWESSHTCVWNQSSTAMARSEARSPWLLRGPYPQNSWPTRGKRASQNGASCQLLGCPKHINPSTAMALTSHHRFVQKPCTNPLEDTSTSTSTHTAYIILYNLATAFQLSAPTISDVSTFVPAMPLLVEQCRLHGFQPSWNWRCGIKSGNGLKKTKSKKHQSFTCLMSLINVCFMPSKKDVWMTVGDLTPMRLKKVKSRPKITQKMDQGNNQQYFNPKKKINCCAHNYSCPFVTYTICTNMYKPWHISSTLGPTPSSNLRPLHHWVDYPEADARSRNLRGRESLVPCFGWEKSMGKYMSTWWFTPVRGKTYGKAYSCLVVHTSGF